MERVGGVGGRAQQGQVSKLVEGIPKTGGALAQAQLEGWKAPADPSGSGDGTWSQRSGVTVGRGPTVSSSPPPRPHPEDPEVEGRWGPWAGNPLIATRRSQAHTAFSRGT